LRGQNAPGSSAAASASRHDDRLPGHPTSPSQAAGHAPAVRATPVPSHCDGDARPLRSPFRPPPSHPKWRRPHDRRGAFALMHNAGDAYATPPDDSSPERGAPLQQCRRHRSCILRLQARPDWGRPKRDRTPPNPGLPVPLNLAAATSTTPTPTSASRLCRVVSGRVHPSAAA
jgi:hypothetical protein